MGKAKVTKKFSAPEWVVGVMGSVGTWGSFRTQGTLQILALRCPLGQ